MIECSFLVPVRRDAILSDGGPHPSEEWQWLLDEMFVRFGGATLAAGLFRGFYRDPDTGERVSDRSRRYTVAVDPAQLNELREMIREVCGRFHQKCIYASFAGQVEFIGAKSE